MKPLVCRYCGTSFSARRSRKYCTPEHQALAFSKLYTVIADHPMSFRAPVGGWENGGVYRYEIAGGLVIQVTHIYPNTGVEIIGKKP